MTKLEKQARALALAWINQQRTAAGLAPIKHIYPLWWRIHGGEWITKALKGGQ